jgi:predicted RNA-binding Zn ribbon-like protein
LKKESERYQLEAGRLCLDFADTAAWHASHQPEEQLNHYADLVEWAAQTRIVTPDEARTLLTRAAEVPQEAERVRGAAVALREVLYRTFAAIAQDEAPDAADLAALNTALARSLVDLRIQPDAEGFDWEWPSAGSALDGMLGPVVWSAANLLTGDDLNRVRQCADDRGCGWLFIDMSRNRSRRWCGMEGCGNRAKARRHYERTRDARAQRDGG